MKSKKISELNNLETSADTDLVAIVDVSETDITKKTKKQTKANLLKEVTQGLSTKVDKETGKGLSANDYTTDEKNKLAGIEAGAEVNNVTEAEKEIWDAKQDALGFTPENSSNKGQNNGYAELDSGGKVPLSRLPSTLLVYKGVWNANTNTPALTSTDTNKKGWVYTVTVAGSQFGIDWKLGDWLIYNDAGVAEKSDNSDDVVTVNGQQGVVVLDTDDIEEGVVSQYFTVERAQGAVTETFLKSTLGSASTSTDGYLTSTDWNTFNGKQNALGYTPYNATNPSGYISGIDSGMVVTALGFTPYSNTNPSGYVSNLSSFTTANLSENTNLYFTSARAVTAMSGLYEVPLSFGSGITRTANAVANDLITGKTGGLTVKGGTAVADTLKLQGTTGNGTLTAVAVQILVGNAGATTALTVLNNGNVGIGTTTPTSQITVSNTNGVGNTFKFTDGTRTFTDGSNGVLSWNAAAHFGSGTFGGVGDTEYYGLNDGSNRASFYVKGYGTGALFRLDNSSAVTQMIITSAGNVGIGTTNPLAPLDVTGTERIYNSARTAYLLFDGENSNISLAGGSILSIQSNGLKPVGIVNNSLYVNTSGNVGIGTTSPTAVLHLKAGTATASTAPLKFTSGTLLTTAEAGVVEFDGTSPYFTRIAGQRERIGTILTKATTGDATGAEGLFQINTTDLTFKIYAGGAWRPLATW